MLGLGYQELIVLLVILLVLFGASRLPRLARALGSSLVEFRAGVRGTDRPAAPKEDPGERS
jgi:sec-independent protein translocase protein TatA